MDTFETFEHVGKDGITYKVEYFYDTDTTLEDYEEFAVVTEMDFDPTDEGVLDDYIETYEPTLEKEAQLRLMRKMTPHRGFRPLFFDVFATQQKFMRDSGVSAEEAMRYTEQSFDFFNGWYNEEWYFIGIRVTPLDEEGNPEPDYAESIWGVEYRHNNDLTEYIDDLIAESNWNRRRSQNEGQLEINFN